jgi:hypothetical protein
VSEQPFASVTITAYSPLIGGVYSIEVAPGIIVKDGHNNH